MNLTKRKHYGYNVKRLRELRGFKQDILADGLKISQQSVSALESTDDIDDATLEKIATILNFPIQVIKEYSDDAIIQHINNFYDNSSLNTNCTFNPIDKLVEILDENRKLYERLLALQQERIDDLKRNG